MVQKVWSNQIDSILCVGESLEMLGVRNWALDQVDALNALEIMRGHGIAVAGGDVYRQENARLEPTCDDWYCNRSDGEQMSHYVERSIGLARNYISDYPNSDGRAFFSLVPSAR